MSHSKFPHAWVHRGFDELSRGRCEDGGANLYVNARGVIEMIHRTDVNHDGYADLIFPNSHGYTERGPTWIYEPLRAARGDWPRRELPNDSGWMSRVADVDGDGYDDLIVVNGENGVTSASRPHLRLVPFIEFRQIGVISFVGDEGDSSRQIELAFHGADVIDGV